MADQGLDKTQAGIESGIAKAREAQKKFEETKAKVEETKKKADAAVKKAKEVQQQIKVLKAMSKTPGGLKAGIAVMVAMQVGMLRGKLVVQLQNRVIEMLNKFSSGCPNAKELEKIIRIRSTLLNHLTSFENRLKKFSTIATQLTTIITLLNVAIKIITSIPVPTAIIPPMSGGVGIPVSVLTKYSNTLVKLNKRLDRLTGEAAAITLLLSSVLPIITNLKDRLNSIDLAIEQCSIGEPADLAQILSTVQPTAPLGSEGTPKDANYYYKGYVLAIVEDPNSPKIAPRRYAIASDKGGTVRLRGESSFSSSTQVLLDEIKFKIDNQFT